MDTHTLFGLHGILMAVGWLVLIPAGMWMSTIGKHHYPNQWFTMHAIIMALATVDILTSGILAFSLKQNDHFDNFHTILGPLLNILLALQALGGLVMAMREAQSERAPLNKVHKFLGLFLWIGGVLNVLLGAYIYAIDAHSSSIFTFYTGLLVGLVTMAQLYLFSIIFPVWFEHWSADPHYGTIIVSEDAPV